MMLLEFALKALAVLTIVWVFLSIVLPSLLAPINVAAISLVFLTVVFATLIGTVALTIDLLYPGTLLFAGSTNLLLFVTASSATSTLFMLVMEGPVVKILRVLSLDRAWAQMGFAFVHGVVTAPLLLIIARYVTGVDLVIGSAMAVGLITAVGFHLAETIFVHSGSIGIEEMALIDPSEDGERDR